MAATPVELTWDQVLSWRMDRQLLHRLDDIDTTAIVQRPAGVHAQVTSSAEQAVGVRWGFRGTLHLLTAEDAG